MTAGDTPRDTETAAERPLVGEALREALADLIGIPPQEIADDANLIKLGLESLHMMRLLTRAQRSGAALTFRDLAAEPTCSAWSRLMANALGVPAEPASADSAG